MYKAHGCSAPVELDASSVFCCLGGGPGVETTTTQAGVVGTHHSAPLWGTAEVEACTELVLREAGFELE